MDMGITSNNNGGWILFQHPKLGRFGILCIYAPSRCNVVGERTELWKELIDTLHKEMQWIMMGDFNMIESPWTRSKEVRTVLAEERREHGHNSSGHSKLMIPLLCELGHLGIVGITSDIFPTSC